MAKLTAKNFVPALKENENVVGWTFAEYNVSCSGSEVIQAYSYFYQ